MTTSEIIEKLEPMLENLAKIYDDCDNKDGSCTMDMDCPMVEIYVDKIIENFDLPDDKKKDLREMLTKYAYLSRGARLIVKNSLVSCFLIASSMKEREKEKKEVENEDVKPTPKFNIGDKVKLDVRRINKKNEDKNELTWFSGMEDLVGKTLTVSRNTSGGDVCVEEDPFILSSRWLVPASDLLVERVEVIVYYSDGGKTVKGKTTIPGAYDNLEEATNNFLESL